MKYAPYPRYKSSGVEWLGDVPDHWQTNRLRSLVSLRNEKTEAHAYDALPYVGLEHVEGWTGCLLPLSEELVPEGISNRFHAGSVLLGKLRPYLAKAFVADFDGLCSSELLVFQPARIEPRFLLYQLLTEGFVSFVDSSTYGAKMPRASWEFIGNVSLTTPPPDEQLAIAAFLDAETAKIDALIEKKLQLIERLKEKRAALISRTVTRGLPPNAAIAAGLDPQPRLKSSGAEWLGDIPEHWDAAQLRRFTRFITSGSRGWAEHYADEGAVFIRIGNLTRHSIELNLSDIQYVGPPAGAEGKRTQLRAGDILFSITAYLGSVAVVSESLPVSYVNQHVALARVDSRLLPQFVGYAALADLGQSQLNLQAYGGTKMQLALDDVLSLWIPVPSITEQYAIVDYLREETLRQDQLIDSVQRATQRLQEYRSALITAAVTGKIDVRGYAA
jgi:type I restriction enzyme S subunit